MARQRERLGLGVLFQPAKAAPSADSALAVRQ
jgi:hypothetical protein